MYKIVLFNTLTLTNWFYFSFISFPLYTPPRNNGGVLSYGITLDVRLSYVCPSVFSFTDDVSEFTPNSLCAVVAWRSDFGLLMGKSHHFLTVTVRIEPECHFRMITLVNINGFSPNLVFALILWKSALELLMGIFCQFLTELSARDTSVFSFLGDNLSKYRFIFTKLGMCIDIVDICFGIANGRMSSIFTELFDRNTFLFYFQDNNLSKS